MAIFDIFTIMVMKNAPTYNVYNVRSETKLNW